MIWQPPYDFRAARPTFVDQWPREWLDLTPDHILVWMDAAEMNALGWQIAGYSRLFSEAPSSALTDLMKRLDDAIASLGRSCFIRFTSRSPKDSLRAARSGMRVANGMQALALVLEGSGRCASDLRMALDAELPLAFVIRKWIDFSPQAEFRCFMKDGVWAGGNQAVGNNVDVCDTYQRSIVKALRGITQQLVSAAPLENAAFDIACVSGAGKDFDAILLDVNPLIDVTDLGLYSTDKAFDGAVRFRTIVGGEESYTAVPIG